MGILLLLALALAQVAFPASGADLASATVVSVIVDRSLFPEQDDTEKLSRAGKLRVSSRYKAKNAAWRKLAEDIFAKSDVLSQMGLLVVPRLDPDASDTGELKPDFVVVPVEKWESIKKTNPQYRAFFYPKTDGRGGEIAVFYSPALLKSRLDVMAKVDKLTEGYVDELLTKKLGLHPSETSQIAARLKEQVRQSLSPEGGILKAGRDVETQFIKNVSDKFVKEYLAPELNKGWTGHDPEGTITSAHKPGDRESASEGGAGHNKTIPTAPTAPGTPAKPATPAKP
jgi:hypothetical protein